LHVGIFWVEMKGTWERTKLKAENGQLKQQNIEVVKQNAQLNTKIHTIQAQHTVEKQVQSVELTSLKTNLEAAREREIAAIPQQVVQQTELTELRAETSRLRTQKAVDDRRINELETRAVTAEHQNRLNQSYEKLEVAFNAVVEAKKENRNLGTAFTRLKRELEDYIANYKRALPGSEPVVDHLFQIVRNAITASEFQAKMEATLSRLSPPRVKPVNQFQQEIVS
jgi:chromosome segregation ATPase